MVIEKKRAWVHRLSKIDFEKRKALCSNCGIVTILTKNVTRKKTGKGSLARCLYSVRYKGMSTGIKKPSDSICEICKNETKLVFDHDHQTMLHRGWLCHKCNRLLGQANDRVDILQSAIDYLKR